MLSNPIENPIHYSREQDLRYTSLSEVSRSISSYAVDTVSSNRLSMTDYDVQSIHPANHRPYDPGSLVNSQTAFERYDPNYLQRTSMYASYSQPSIEELANQQKYLLEHSHHHNHNSDLKTEPEDSPGTPIYPRPIYQSYDPTGTFIEKKKRKRKIWYYHYCLFILWILYGRVLDPYFMWMSIIIDKKKNSLRKKKSKYRE
jgi:hypothetical protein